MRAMSALTFKKFNFGASAGIRTRNNGSVDRRDIHFTTNAYCKIVT